MMSRFWYTASAVPRYQCSSPTRCWAGQHVDHLVELGAQEAPAALQVAHQRVRLVLRDDRHAPDAGIEAIRQREVDDPELAAEVDRRLGASVGQLLEPGAAAARQHQGDGAANELVGLQGRVARCLPSVASVGFLPGDASLAPRCAGGSCFCDPEAARRSTAGCRSSGRVVRVFGDPHRSPACESSVPAAG